MRYIKTEGDQIIWNYDINNENFIQSQFYFCTQKVKNKVKEFIEGNSKIMSMTINNKEHTLIK